MQTGGMLDALRTNIEDGSASAREGGLRAAAALFERVGAPAEPFLVSLLPALLDRFADKVGRLGLQGRLLRSCCIIQ